MAKANLNRCTAILKEIANELMRPLKTDYKAVKWQRAILDVRSPVTGGVRNVKFRWEVPSGEPGDPDYSMEVSELLAELWELKDKAFPDKWYGLKITLQPNGKCETEFN